ncbi:MAG TPA: hypothetical protein VFP89_02600 [Propionibacteriaceae bacterium]|nr:hypothetical protein [Propionibacteriaceae bacterium]
MSVVARRPMALAAAMVGMLALAAPAPSFAADRVEFTISAPAIQESSGLAADTGSTTYWTVNDSGAAGVVFALAPNGSLKGMLQYRATPVDVEALAIAGGRLYVADIGDNQAKRASVTVYLFDGPTPQAQPQRYQAIDFRYPDGAHDAETLLVDASGRIYLVTKEARGGIYAAPRQPSRQAVNLLERVGDAPAYVTDGVFLPQQNAIALRTYLSVELLAADTYQPKARAALPQQPQGESITRSLDGRSLLVGSEGAKSVVYRVDIPGELSDAPSGVATPPGSTPSAGATEGDSPGSASEDPNAGRGRGGTFSALGLAAVVAVVAGAVVGLAKRP